LGLLDQDPFTLWAWVPNHVLTKGSAEEERRDGEAVRRETQRKENESKKE